MPTSIYSILPLISGLSVLGLGIFVFWKNKKNKVNLLFGIFSLCIAIWLIGSFFMLSSKTDDWIIFWDRVVYIGVIFIPIIGYHFSLLFTKSVEKEDIEMLLMIENRLGVKGHLISKIIRRFT